MKRTLIIITVTFLFMLTFSCSVDQITKYHNNFNRARGDFEFMNSPTMGKTEIVNGELHLKAKDNDDFDSAASATFFKEIPRNSIVYFKVKFGEYYNTQHPMGHFNFLEKDADNRINFMVGTDWFGYFTSVNGTSEPDSSPLNHTFNQYQYYLFTFHLKQDTIDIYLDNELLKTITYVEGLPESGSFVFECHNEYWIDYFGFTTL